MGCTNQIWRGFGPLLGRSCLCRYWASPQLPLARRHLHVNTLSRKEVYFPKVISSIQQSGPGLNPLWLSGGAEMARTPPVSSLPPPVFFLTTRMQGRHSVVPGEGMRVHCFIPHLVVVEAIPWELWARVAAICDGRQRRSKPRSSSSSRGGGVWVPGGSVVDFRVL